MKNFLLVALTCTMLCASNLAFSASHTAAPAVGTSADGKPMKDEKTMQDDKGMGEHHRMMHMMGMKKMDANGDGLISKEEFMKYHEKMFDALPKNKDGLVDPNNMGMGMMEKKK